MIKMRESYELLCFDPSNSFCLKSKFQIKTDGYLRYTLFNDRNVSCFGNSICAIAKCKYHLGKIDGNGQLKEFQQQEGNDEYITDHTYDETGRLWMSTWEAKIMKIK